jgi:5-methyltetrahydrofolate--homocysteine methyltransferase
MADLEEMRAAVEAVRQVSPEIPIITTMTFDTHGRTMMGVTPEKRWCT